MIPTCRNALLNQTPLLIGLACLDGRFDHALADSCVDDTAPTGRSCWWVRMMWSGSQRMRISAEADAGVGLAAWPSGIWCFDGLRWRLDGLTMAAGSTVGTSNEAQGGMVHIRPSQTRNARNTSRMMTLCRRCST